MTSAGARVLHALLCLMVLSLSFSATPPLRFDAQGNFKILQIADMHFGDGETTRCRDIPPSEVEFCSDLNTTAFTRRLLVAEAPDFVVFTGDNIDSAATDAEKSMDAAFSPVIEAQIPWAAVLGNHDQESSLLRSEVMAYITKQNFSLSKVLSTLRDDSGSQEIHGWGNYFLQVVGPLGTEKENTSLLNLYFLDSGDYSKVEQVEGYDWIRASQQVWFLNLSKKLNDSATASQVNVPALAYFHIPVPEYDVVLGKSKIYGEKHEEVCSASVNSGFFSSLLEARDVKATFVGHDHVNDYCGDLMGISLCYGGGTGYHGYGKIGWDRRARVVMASLEGIGRGIVGTSEISTWKRLDDLGFSEIDRQVLYRKKTQYISLAGLDAFKRATKCWSWGTYILGGILVPLACASYTAGFLWSRRRTARAQYMALKLKHPSEARGHLKKCMVNC